MVTTSKKKNCYKLGDQNTKYFHACTSQHKRTNRILAVQNDQDELAESQEEIHEVFRSFFQHTFNSSCPSTHDTEKGTKCVPRKVTDDMNRSLSAVFTEEKVFLAVKQIALLKSLGPDGAIQGSINPTGILWEKR